MARTKRFIALILVVVICLTAFAGCKLFTQNTAETRAQVVATVNGEDITLGEFYDTYNALYYQYYYYIYYGYYTYDDIAQMTYSSLVNSRIMLSYYKELAESEGLVYNHEFSNYKNAKYLTADEMTYIFKSIKKTLFESYDSAIEDALKADGYTLATASDTTEVNRTAPVYQNISSILDIKTEITDEAEIEAYLAQTAGGLDQQYLTNAEGYIYTDLSAESLTQKVAELNARITLAEGQTALTAEEYVQYQKKAVASTKETVFSEYGLNLDDCVTYEIEAYMYSRLISTVAAKIFKIYAESDPTALLANLEQYYQVTKTTTEENYILNPTAYETLVEALSNTSFIYTIPAEYEGKYIYVKNCLVPFSEEQIEYLEEKATELGETTQAYIDFREEYASQIVLENFITGEVTQNVFYYDAVDGKLKIVEDSVLDNAMNNINQAADFENLMYKYNTDTAQFDADYDYVVRVNAPTSYTAKWVTEFVTGAKEAYSKGVGGTSLAVSAYGVHIIYYTATVQEQTFNFTMENIFDTSTKEYAFYSMYYDKVINGYVTDKVSNIKENAKITTTKALKDFLETNGWEIEID
ncbi:MAG TPA: SurA N-terminal domain-containing protein [Clostridia bacterium]|nr:SurA N-terminal domain-containing protein [Clostridia bacterium]